MKIKLPVTKIIHDLPLFIRLIKVIMIEVVLRLSWGYDNFKAKNICTTQS